MTYPEVAPTIIVDKEIGQAVDDLDIDVAACTELLRQHGMDDETINSLEVNINLKTVFNYLGRFTRDGKRGILFRAINGRYYPNLNTVDLYLGSILTEQTEEESADKIAQETLIHEFGHALHDNNGTMVELSTLHHMLSISTLGTVATAGILNAANVDPKLWPASLATGAALFVGQAKHRKHQIAQEEAVTQQFTEEVDTDSLKILTIEPKPGATEKLNRVMISTVKSFEHSRRQNTAFNKVVRVLTNRIINYTELLDKNNP